MNFTGTALLFKPFSPRDIGVYKIDIVLQDGYCQPRIYNMMVTVEKGKPMPVVKGPERAKASIRIMKVNRDSTVDIKLIMPKAIKLPPSFRLNFTNEEAHHVFQNLTFTI